MDYKLFPAGSVPDGLLEDLRPLPELPVSDRTVLVEWFGSYSNDFDPERYEAALAQTTLTPRRFDRLLEGLRIVLNAWKRTSVTVDDLLADLLLLGFAEEEIIGLRSFFSELLSSGAPARIYEAALRAYNEGIGSPTLEDVNITCQLRPIFEEYAWPPPVKGGGHDPYDQLLGFLPMVLLEFRTVDYAGNKQRFSVQLDETEFGKLRTAMNRADRQYEIMKARMHLLDNHSSQTAEES